MSGHAVVPDLARHPAALEAMLAELTRAGIQHSTLQLEIVDHCEASCLGRGTGDGGRGTGVGGADRARKAPRASVPRP